MAPPSRLPHHGVAVASIFFATSTSYAAASSVERPAPTELPTDSAPDLFSSWASSSPPSPSASSATPALQIDPETGLFRDDFGRARIFHGMNVVYKEAPWYPPSEKFTTTDSLDEETIELMRRWGFNVVRLGVMWPGVEPSPGVIDKDYLSQVKKLSKSMGKKGIYTLVDLHQDVGSRRFCGEGFPEHYIDALDANASSAFARAAAFPRPQRFEIPLNASGDPPLSECLKRQFASYYLTDRVGAMWAELYRPGSALNEGFLRYWKAVADTFHNSPEVLGYELLNEPSGFCLDPNSPFDCLESAKALGNAVEKEKLTPLYQAAAKVIRGIDPSTPIFYEPTVLPKPFADAFPEPALANETQQGMAYHIYCPPGDGDGPVQGAVCIAAQDLFAKTYFGFLKKHRGLGGFMSEFGAVGGNEKELDHLQRLLNMADGNFQSWTYWMLKKYSDFTTANAAESLYDENGDLEVAKLKTLSRTFAPAIAGTPRKMKFDPVSGSFNLTFTLALANAATEVYLNEALNYPGGFSVEVRPENCLNWSQNEQNFLEFTVSPGATCMNSDISISISRTSSQEPTEVIV